MVYLFCLLWGLFVAFVLDIPFWASLLIGLVGATAITVLESKLKKK